MDWDFFLCRFECIICEITDQETDSTGPNTDSKVTHEILN